MRSSILTLCLAATLSACTIEVAPPQGSASGAGVPATSSASDGIQPSTRIYRSAAGTPASLSVAQASATLGEGDLTVLMVVDRSGSMGDPWDGSTKWNIVRSALDAAIVGVEDQVTIGTIFFPMDDACDVAPLHDPRQIQLQSGGHFQGLLSQIPDSLGGATPMLAAFSRADEAILQAAADGALDQRFRVVVMTDGMPNCSGLEDEMVAYADGWRAMGIDVRVLGLPGSEQAARLLDRIAGKEVDETAPYVPPPTVVDTSQDSQDTGYVAPSSTGDVEDSLHPIVR